MSGNHFPERIILASASPRRRQLLEEAGFKVHVHPPHVDDGLLRATGVNPHWWVMALAYLKARSCAERMVAEPHDIIIGADTVCVLKRCPLGQPRDVDDARAMLRALRNGSHQTMTGIALLAPRSRARLLTWDSATVRVGALTDDAVEAYLSSGNWRGKAGAYNLRERIDAGWPIACEGDPATVMGLPMRRLPSLLERMRSRPDRLRFG